MARMIDFYNAEVDRYQGAGGKNKAGALNRFLDPDLKKISWSSSLTARLSGGHKRDYRLNAIVESTYRPFSKSLLYFDPFFNHRPGQMPRIFPTEDAVNRVIAVSGVGASEFSVLMMDLVPCLDVINKSQCFPRYLYEQAECDKHMPGWQEAGDDASPAGYRKWDALTDAGLAHIQSHYPGETITKDDVFYYVYGLLHSPDYRERFANNLSRDLPRIPCVASIEDFRAFAEAGHKLGDLHVDYERAKPYPVELRIAGDKPYDDLTAADLRVSGPWKFGGKSKNKDRTVVRYNDKITMTGVPVEAYDYMVNGKPALQWVMERQVVKTDKKSGIVSDANEYAVETMEDPAYPLKLFQRVITVSLETLHIVRDLPPLRID